MSYRLRLQSPSRDTQTFDLVLFWDVVMNIEVQEENPQLIVRCVSNLLSFSVTGHELRDKQKKKNTTRPVL